MSETTEWISAVTPPDNNRRVFVTDGEDITEGYYSYGKWFVRFPFGFIIAWAEMPPLPTVQEFLKQVES